MRSDGTTEDLDTSISVLAMTFMELHAAGISINLVFDNAVDAKDSDDYKYLLELGKAAFEADHHVVLVCQSRATAMAAAKMRGDMIRMSEGQRRAS
eukprot:3095604-Amphidinium_carterae.1